MADANDKGKDKGRQLLDQLQTLSTRAAADFFQFLDRVNQARDAADGTAFSGGDNSGVSKDPRPVAGELLFDLVKLQLDTAERLLSLGHKQADLLFDRAQRAASPFVPVDRRIVTLTADTKAKRAAHWEVYVQNAAHRARRIELTPETGWREVDGDVEVAPCGATIPSPQVPARGERKVEIVQEPLEELEAGKTYRAEVSVVLERRTISLIELVLRVQ